MSLTKQQALEMFESDDLIGIGMEADAVRRKLHPEGTVTYIIDRNINYTNFCTEYSTFAAAGRGTCNTGNALDLTVTLPPARFGYLEGLLGDPGAPPDELLGGNGAKYNMNVLSLPWASPHNFDVLYHQFAPTWRVSHQSSLFYYPKGTSTATFTDLNAPSKALTVRSMAPKTALAAKKDCKAAGITNGYLLNECTYDVGLTNGRGVCLAAADDHVQATIGGPSAKGLHDRCDSLPAPRSV